MKSSTAVFTVSSFWLRRGSPGYHRHRDRYCVELPPSHTWRAGGRSRIATLLGPARVISKELPGMNFRGIDVDLSAQGPAPAAHQIIAELCTPYRDSVVAIRRGERWTETLEPVQFQSNAIFGGFRKKGVYLITGGLGDLGLMIAEELAREFEARLVLLGRTPLVPPQQWKRALESTETHDHLKSRIAKLIELESLGSEILYLSCDVSRRNEMKWAIHAARTRFGSINGVIHAAGVIDDGPLLLKSCAKAARVLDPKVEGTLILTDVLTEATANDKQHEVLDFIALFSSVSSLSAPAGQVDYVAANAFLNTFAASRRDVRVIAINWDAWRDVGMAARASSTHPLLGRRLVDTGSEIVYQMSLSRERHWVLADHRLKTGRAVFPGTGYLEIAAAALTHGSFDQGVAFEDVFFQAPLLANPAQSQETQLNLRRTDDGTFQFWVRTGDHGSIEHASGRIQRRLEPRHERVVLDVIRARCRSCVLTFDETRRTHQEQYFDFGPRWRCLKAIEIGTGEAIAALELPAAFAGDTSLYQLHPALLDLATGSALYLIADYGTSSTVYFPFYYKSAAVFRRIPASFFSHIRSRRGNASDRDVATFDLTLIDEEGMVLAEIDGFSMRQARDRAMVLASCGSTILRPRLGIALSTTTRTGGSHLLWERMRFAHHQVAKVLRGLCLARRSKRRHSSHRGARQGYDQKTFN